MTNPIRPTDDDARKLARGLIDSALFGALGVIDPDSGAPHVTRVAVGTAPDGTPLTLISDLSAHTRALRAKPLCSLLVGEPGAKGDPLTHPRLTLTATARWVSRNDPDFAPTRSRYLDHQPKAQLYADFADFNFVLFDVTAAALNGGFGKAFVLTPADILPRR